AAGRHRLGPPRRARRHRAHPPGHVPRRAGPRTRGPPARRPDRRAAGGGQPGPQPARPPPVLPLVARQPPGGAPPRRPPGRGVRRAHAVDRHPGRQPVGRQPAEGHHRPRVLPRRPVAGAQPADPGAGRGLDPVHPPPGRRQARRGRGGAAQLVRARRGPRPGRPHRRDLPGPDRRRARPGGGQPRAARPAHGRRGRRGRGGRGHRRGRGDGHVTTATEEPPAPPPPAGGDGGAAATGGGRGRSVVGRLAAVGIALVGPVLALVTALVVGGLVMVFTDPDTLDEWGLFFADPAGALEASWDLVFESYRALWRSSVGSSAGIGRTLVEATPLALAGLSVAFAFRAGLFNIGGAGQLVIGASCAGWVGFTWDLPAAIHLPLAVVAGFLGGAAWGAIAGVLKARTGAHEVITTIMLNYIAYYTLDYALRSDAFRPAGRSDLISKPVRGSARLPEVSLGEVTVHAGVFIALVAAVVVWWLLERTTTGFRLRAV